jgi:hypothetical protein
MKSMLVPLIALGLLATPMAASAQSTGNVYSDAAVYATAVELAIDSQWCGFIPQGAAILAVTGYTFEPSTRALLATFGSQLFGMALIGGRNLANKDMSQPDFCSTLTPDVIQATQQEAIAGANGIIMQLLERRQQQGGLSTSDVVQLQHDENELQRLQQN